jgi:hypothetical protein
MTDRPLPSPDEVACAVAPLLRGELVMAIVNEEEECWRTAFIDALTAQLSAEGAGAQGVVDGSDFSTDELATAGSVESVAVVVTLRDGDVGRVIALLHERGFEHMLSVQPSNAPCG